MFLVPLCNINTLRSNVMCYSTVAIVIYNRWICVTIVTDHIEHVVSTTYASVTCFVVLALTVE